MTRIALYSHDALGLGHVRRSLSLARAFSESTYVSEPHPDIMRAKYQKLLMNLGNSIEATCGRSSRGGERG